MGTRGEWQARGRAYGTATEESKIDMTRGDHCLALVVGMFVISVAAPAGADDVPRSAA